MIIKQIKETPQYSIDEFKEFLILDQLIGQGLQNSPVDDKRCSELFDKYEKFLSSEELQNEYNQLREAEQQVANIRYKINQLLNK